MSEALNIIDIDARGARQESTIARHVDHQTISHVILPILTDAACQPECAALPENVQLERHYQVSCHPATPPPCNL
ncbi:MAG: hypothetical protein ACRDB8_18475, partial [Aeromonas veronii]